MARRADFICQLFRIGSLVWFLSHATATLLCRFVKGAPAEPWISRACTLWFGIADVKHGPAQGVLKGKERQPVWGTAPFHFVSFHTPIDQPRQIRAGQAPPYRGAKEVAILSRSSYNAGSVSTS